MSADENAKIGKLRGFLGGRGKDGARIGAQALAERQEAVLLLHDYEASGLGWFWSTDREGRVTYISDCVADAIGKSGAELLGQPLHSLFVIERSDDDLVQRSLPLILSSRKTFSEVPFVRPTVARMPGSRCPGGLRSRPMASFSAFGEMATI